MKKFRKIAAVMLVLVFLGIGSVWGLGCCVFSSPGYKGPVSDHFNGKEFFNPWPGHKKKGFSDFWRWQFSREHGEWPDWIDAEPGPKPPERAGVGELRVTFINHASVLIQMEGFNFLTDPIWSERASPVSWAGPRRHRPPGIRFEDLPPIDAVLLSHNHYDSLDVATLRRLVEKFHMPIYAGLGTKAYLDEEGIAGGVDLDWWNSRDLSDTVRLHAVPARHFSSRGTCDRNRTLWLGFVIQSLAGNVYFAGDTGWGPHFEEIGRRFKPLRFALLPIGAYLPRWFMGEVHVGPDESVRAHKVMGIFKSMAIHFGTFELADDSFDEPRQDLAKALESEGFTSDDFWVLSEGEGRDVPPISR